MGSGKAVTTAHGVPAVTLLSIHGVRKQWLRKGSPKAGAMAADFKRKAKAAAKRDMNPRGHSLLNIEVHWDTWLVLKEKPIRRRNHTMLTCVKCRCVRRPALWQRNECKGLQEQPLLGQRVFWERLVAAKDRISRKTLAQAWGLWQEADKWFARPAPQAQARKKDAVQGGDVEPNPGPPRSKSECGPCFILIFGI